ncbi:putative membrane protein [Rathayibacter sp. PhB151]|uniref:cytochrome c oxidase assembly protein n=1 Tax=Rathayibacter sp. PhB151 TaxID=2485189 RepID=UPI0010632C6A|nr:cytochrome c oxidase assembly protein [Rathayibacter sp. PhB151]TDX74898.1 putative membrane protein [Rathayibacter sp. PhB151]
MTLASLFTRLPDAPPSLDSFLTLSASAFPAWGLFGILLSGVYIIGVARLWWTRRRWPWWRAGSFLLGCAILVITMASGLEDYGREMFSIFMFQQLTLMMAIPPLLVLGSPGTLLLRATPHRWPGRVVLLTALALLRARTSRLLLHPGFTIPLFLLLFYGLYFSDLDELLLDSAAGHLGLEVLFLAAGVVFAVPLLSADPLPVRQTHLGRMFDLFAEMPLHAFFGVIVMMSASAFVAAFQAPASWGVDPIADQQIAGALAWSYGELPSLLIVLLLLVRWQRDDTRAARAADRAGDENGTPDLDAYNEYLQGLNRRAGAPQSPPDVR